MTKEYSVHADEYGRSYVVNPDPITMAPLKAEGQTAKVDPGYNGPKGYGLREDAPSPEYARQIALAFMEGDMEKARGLVEQYGWREWNDGRKTLAREMYERFCT